MAPQQDNPYEVEGVLNPAGVSGPDGRYYLFPRLVAADNYSRIGVAHVQRDGCGRPTGVERLGLALQPEAPYERIQSGRGGCEDARVTYLPHARRYVMAYTALGPSGARVALASSEDLRTWARHGLIDLAPERGADFNAFSNKDAVLFQQPVRDPSGALALALLHRPIYETRQGPGRAVYRPLPPPAGVTDARPGIWISYCPLDACAWLSGHGVARFGQHRLVALPHKSWEAYRIGAGSVPLWTAAGWLTFYHGVKLVPGASRCYQAGALLLAHDDPGRVLARTPAPIFGPATVEERVGVVANVVFPTAVEPRRGGVDVYYGMADARIGVVHLRPTRWDAAGIAA
jgi:predicted GH43/DUF377 family glycosyl hydrolase